MTDINLKALTLTSPLPPTGVLFGSDSQATASPSVYSTQTVATTLLGSTTLTGAPALSADAPVLNLSQTWSNLAVTFTGIKYNTTNTNSAAASLLMDLQVDTVSKFNVTKTGAAYGTLIGSTTATFGISATTGIGFFSSNRVSVLADGQVAMFFGSSQNVVANGRSLSFESAASGAGDTFITRKAAASFRFGAADAATPVAQTLSVQSVVAGTSNFAGQPFTVNGSQGTGTGAGGSLIFQVAPAGSASTFTVTFTNGSATINGTGLPTTAGTAVAFTTTGALPTNFAINTTYFILAGSTSTAITVAATAGGTAIVAGSAGSGTQTLTQALAQNALAAAMTIASDYSATFVGNLRLADGTSSVASLGFNNGGSYNLGFYKAGTNSIGIISSSGVYARLGGNSNAFFMRSDAFLSWSSTTGYAAADTILLRDDANTLAQRNSTAAQAFRVYNTYTDASNYERGVFDWTTTANTLTIGMQRAGTGTARGINFVDGGGTTRLTITAGTGIVTVAGVEISTSSSIAVFSAASSGYTFRYIGGTNSDMMIRFTGITASFPALKRSTTSLQVRLADDTGFTNIQGKLTTDTAYTAGVLVATGYITIYDSTGTAYRVPCLV
jgi:hypothetical protein